MRWRSFYWKLCTALLLLTMTPTMLVTAIAYRQSARVLREEIDAQHALLLEELKSGVENSLSVIKADMINLFFYSDAVAHYLNLTTRSGDLSKTKRMQNEISAFQQKHAYLVDVLVYLRLEDFFLTTSGSYDSEFYFSALQPAGLRKKLEAPAFFAPISVANFKKSSGATVADALLFNTTMPQGEEYRMIFTVVIDKQLLFRAYQRVGLMKNGALLILDADGNLLASDAPRGADSFVSEYMRRATPDAGGGLLSVEGESFLVYRIASKGSGWQYVAILPYREVTAQIDGLLAFVVAVCAALLVICALVALYTAKRLYRPVGTVMANFSGPRERDEFSFINDSVCQILTENTALQRQILEMMPALQASFFKGLLRGEMKPEAFRSQADAYGLQLPHKYLAVMLFAFKCDAEYKARLSAALAECGYVYYLLGEGSQFIAVLNFERANFAALLERLRREPLTASQGGVCEGPEGLRDSWTQAMEFMKYKTLCEGFEFIDEGVASARQRGARPYPKDFESAFASDIRTEQADAAARRLRALVDDLLCDDAPLCFLLEIAGRLYAFRNDFGERYGLSRDVGTGPESGDFTSLTSAADFRRAVLRLYAPLFERVQSAGVAKRGAQAKEIVAYIDEHLAEDLSLDMLAERFGLSYHHLSRLLKEYLGRSFIEYLTEQRVAQAKLLLVNTSLKVEEIGARVGYANAVTFVRNFNKLEGASPSQYRKDAAARARRAEG